MKKFNAWVFVIWNDPKYLVGACAAAHSLRMVNTQHDIVLMYANMELPTAFSKLALFTSIRKVDLISFNYKPGVTKGQFKKHDTKFFSHICTKWRCLELTEYNKVAFIDSDMIFQKNSDELFASETPAACFTNAYGKPYEKNGIYNAYGQIGHGSPILPESVKDGLNRGFIAYGALYIFTPSREDLANYIKWMNSLNGYGHPNCQNGPDEQSIVEFYSLECNVVWYHIDQKYEYIPWKPNWLPWSKRPLVDANAIHYIGSKPWEKGEGQGWEDIQLWWSKYHDFERKYPSVAKKLKPLITAYSNKHD